MVRTFYLVAPRCRARRVFSVAADARWRDGLVCVSSQQFTLYPARSIVADAILLDFLISYIGRFPPFSLNVIIRVHARESLASGEFIARALQPWHAPVGPVGPANRYRIVECDPRRQRISSARTPGYAGDIKDCEAKIRNSIARNQIILIRCIPINFILPLSIHRFPLNLQCIIRHDAPLPPPPMRRFSIR